MNLFDQVFQYLQSEGLQPSKDEDNDIIFKYQRLTFIFGNPRDDNEYFRLTLPGIYDVTEDTREAILEVANELNKGMKLSKTMVFDQTVTVSFEIFLDRDPEIAEIVPRAIQVLMDTREELYKKME